MKSEQFWNVDNVSEFRGFEVCNGEVTLDDSQYVDYLNEIYGSVEVCGQSFDQGDLFKDADPVAFRCGKSEYEGQLDNELASQLNREDSDDIKFIDGDEFELDEEEDEEDDE